MTYDSEGSHLIVGIFLGDTIYEQSAGLLNEVVQATTTTTTTTTTPDTGTLSPPTTTQPPTTTTTTQPVVTTTTTLPKPTITMSITATYSCAPADCLYGTSVSDAPVTGPVPVKSYVGFTATAIGSDGTDPSQDGIGDTRSISEVGNSASEGSLGLYGGSEYGQAWFQIYTPGTYVIHVAITGGNPSSPDWGIPASANYTLVVQ